MKLLYTNCDAEIEVVAAARPRTDFTPVVTILTSQGLRTLIRTPLYFATRAQAELYGEQLTRKWMEENSANLRRRRVVTAADPVKSPARRTDRARSKSP